MKPTEQKRLALAVVAVIGLMVAIAIEGNDTMTADFDAEIWKSETAIYEQPFPRLAMIKDVRSRLSSGMSKRDVLDFLGQPTDTPYFEDHDLVYWLGDEKGVLALDSQWLVIDFNDDEELVTHKFVTD